MTYEVEQKFPVADLATLSLKLEQLGAKSGDTAEQTDTYYAHPVRDFAKTDEAFRVRHVGEDSFITYKGPKIDANTKTRREIELPLPADEPGATAYSELLEALGFTAVATVCKTRTVHRLVWQEHAVEIALDDVDSLGTYVELELQADATRLDAARGVIGLLAHELGLEVSERRSYLELLLDSQSDADDGQDES